MATAQTIPEGGMDDDFAIDHGDVDDVDEDNLDDSAMFDTADHAVPVDDNTMVGKHSWAEIRDQVMASFEPFDLPFVRNLTAEDRATLQLLMDTQSARGLGVSLNAVPEVNQEEDEEADEDYGDDADQA